MDLSTLSLITCVFFRLFTLFIAFFFLAQRFTFLCNYPYLLSRCCVLIGKESVLDDFQESMCVLVPLVLLLLHFLILKSLIFGDMYINCRGEFESSLFLMLVVLVSFIVH